MNTLPKSLSIAFLALYIFISGLSADLVRAQSSAPEPMVTLTPEEKAWLIENPHIKLATLTNQPPFSMMDADRNHSGILADILAVLNNAIGQKIETRLVEGAVSDTHEVAKEDGIYGSASILKTSRHANEYLLTDPFMTTPFYIYATTKNRKEIRRPVDLKGKRVAVPRNHRAVAAYLAGIGGVQTIPVDTPLEQMQKVVSGEADVLIGYFTYPYLVNKYLMVDLVIAFIARSDQGIHIGVNPEHPVLLGILNKAIATIGEKQVASITAKWTETSRERISRAELTPEEKDWLNKKHTVRVRVGNHPPWSMNTPEPKGMAIDYLNIIGELYGISFNFVPDNEPWIEGFKDLAGKHLRFDLYPTATRTLERLEYLAMSQTYLSSPWVIFTRVSSTDILRVEDLRGRKVAAERGYVMQKRLEATEPEIELFLVESEKDALLSLSTGEADAYIGNLIVTNFILQKEGISNIKVAGPTPYGDHSQAMATRKDWAPLISIINKGLANIPSEQKITIRNKYLSVRYEHGVTSADILKWVLVVAGAASGFVMFFVVWNKQLSRKVRERTAEVEESETKYRGLVDNSIVGVFASTIEGRFTFVNGAMARMFDFDSPEAMIAQGSIERWREPGDRARMLAELKKHGRVTNFEAETLTHTDRRIDVLSSARQIGNDIFGMVMDVTERKRIERELQKSHNLFKHLLSSIPDAVFSVRLPERVIEWAEDSYNTMGIGDKPGHVQGRSTLKYFAKPEDYKNFGEIQRQAIREGKRYMRTEVMLRREDGTHFPAEVTGTFYRENGEVTRITALARDITDRQQAEQKLLDYQQRLKAMASQLAIVEEKERQRIAVDLHDHVGQSLALARMQLASVRKSAAGSALADTLDDISDTLLEALEDTQHLMLELSSAAMNESGLSAAISEWLDLQIGSRHGIKTEFIDNIPDDPGKKIDANVRAIIFRNVRELLFNVVKHARANKISVRLEDRNTIMRIIVEDDGTGFEPQAVAEAGGKIGGFGLFSIEELMADLGGCLRIVSEPGKGCTAILSVPFGGDDNKNRS